MGLGLPPFNLNKKARALLIPPNNLFKNIAFKKDPREGFKFFSFILEAFEYLQLTVLPCFFLHTFAPIFPALPFFLYTSHLLFCETHCGSFRSQSRPLEIFARSSTEHLQGFDLKIQRYQNIK